MSTSTDTAPKPDTDPEAVRTDQVESDGARPSDDVLTLTATTDEAAAPPDFTPPQEEASVQAADATATVWVSNKKIVNMWSHNSPHNAYAAIEGMGWRKVATGSPAGFVNLTMLLSAAFQTGANTRIKLVDNKIAAVYVF